MKRPISLALLIFLAFCQTALAQNKLLVVTEDWRPYSYQEDGVIKGHSTKIVRSVLDKLDIDYQIKLFPWARTYSMAQTNPNSMIYAIVRTEEREPLFQWVGQVAPTDQVYFYRLKSRSDISFTTLAEAKKYRIGTNLNSDKHQFLEKNDFPHITTVWNQELSLKQLKAGRIDLIIGHKINLRPYLSKVGLKEEDLAEVCEAYESRPFMAFNSKIDYRLYQKAVETYNDLQGKGQIEHFASQKSDAPFCQ